MYSYTIRDLSVGRRNDIEILLGDNFNIVSNR